MAEQKMIKMKEQMNKSEAGAGEGGLLSHLRELRARIIKSLLAIALGFAAAFNFSNEILAFLVMPLTAVLPEGQKLIFTGLPDGFLVHLKIGVWGGVFVSAPLWLYQLWSFVAPGLYRSERCKVIWLAAVATLLLFTGAAFGYGLIFPLAFKFFVGFSNEMLTAMPALGPYFSLATSMLLASGLVFQLPLAIIFMASLGLVNSAILSKGRKYAILIIFIVAAILTPPDVISQCLLAFPMMILYEISIRLVARNERKSAAEEAEALES
ncbi:twin-arginine translocase subunit TatC [Deltaproteobacteria bacterium Smac51]|nr:twin-arginine translocase subunit TatC [Deltaproteobacteria bacterium Smac51]